MSRIGISLIAAALVVGLCGCGASSHRPRSRDRASGGYKVRRERGGSTGQAAQLAAGQPDPDDDADGDEPHASGTQVSDASSVATRFFTTYVAFLYGRLPTKRVTGTDAALRWQLEHSHATTTPTERAARARIGRVTLSSAGPPVSVVAVTTVTTACCAASRLTATLEAHGATWLVVAVTG